MCKFSVVLRRDIEERKLGKVAGVIECELDRDDFIDDFARMKQRYGTSPAVYRDNIRTTDNILEYGFVNFEYDDGLSTPEEVAEMLKGYKFVIMGSKSHMKPKNDQPALPRFHVYLFIGEPITDTDHYVWYAKRLHRVLLKGTNPCECSFKANQYFNPCPHILHVGRGSPLYPSVCTDSWVTYKRTQRFLEEMRRDSNKGYEKTVVNKETAVINKGKHNEISVMKCLEMLSVAGERHSHQCILGGYLKKRGYSKEEAWDFMLPYIKINDNADRKHLERNLQNIYRSGR